LWDRGRPARRSWNANEVDLNEICDLDLFGYPMRAGRPRSQQIT